MPSILSVGRLLGGSILGFSPRSLFAASEPGGWYDPSDLTTVFQDAAGTTPAALESPVGLVLDKSRGLVLGSELVTNGDFSDGTTGWTVSSWTISGGTASCSANSTSLYGGGFTPVAGRTYRVEFDVVSYTSGTLFITVGGNYSGQVSLTGSAMAAGRKSILAVCGSSTSRGIEFYGGGITATIDNISVRELSGNHLSQSTSTARPVLSARVNLLTRTEALNNTTVWTASNCTVSAMDVADPIGGNTAATVTATGNAYFYYSTSANLTSQSLNSVWVRRRTGTGAIKFRTDAANGIDTDYSSSITSSWSLLTWNCAAGTAIQNHFVINIPTSGDAIDLWHPDMRASNAGVGLPSYQRVGAATSGSSSSAGTADYDATKFPTFLKFDGVDDRLVSSGIAWTGNYSAWAGILPNRVTSVQSILDADPGTGTRVPQYIGLNAAVPESIAFSSGGVTTDGGSSVTVSSAVTLSVFGSSTLDVRVNGSSNGATAISGTLNSGTQPLNVGCNPQPSQHFQGNVYSAIVLGRLATAAEIAATETWVNQRTKAY